MQLSARLLNSDAALNSFYEISALKVVKGDSATLVVQLWNKDLDIRYMPAAGATLQVFVSRYPEYFFDPSGQRTTQDYSIQSFAAMVDANDASIWKLPLTPTQTQNITSSGIKLVLTEGTTVRNIVVPRAIAAFNVSE